MAIELTKPEAAALQSLKQYCASELDVELGDLRAKLLLDYVLKELGPFAYNRGVQDAERFMRSRVEDLAATCFEPPLTYWPERKKR